MKRLMILFAVFAAILMVSANALPSFAADACQTSCAKCAKVCEANLKKAEKKKADPATIKAFKDCIAACKDRASGKANKKECGDLCKACATACDNLKDKAFTACKTQCESCSKCCAE